MMSVWDEGLERRSGKGVRQPLLFQRADGSHPKNIIQFLTFHKYKHHQIYTVQSSIILVDFKTASWSLEYIWLVVEGVGRTGESLGGSLQEQN